MQLTPAAEAAAGKVTVVVQEGEASACKSGTSRPHMHTAASLTMSVADGSTQLWLPLLLSLKKASESFLSNITQEKWEPLCPAGGNGKMVQQLWKNSIAALQKQEKQNYQMIQQSTWKHEGRGNPNTQP